MSKSEHYTTAPEDRIPVIQKSAYAIGMLVNNLQAAALPAMVVILNLGLGMNPLWVGLIGFAPRIVDAISDPMMGYISDNTRSRFGRRRPYIFGGVILAGIIFALMWQLPNGYIDIMAKKPIKQHEGLCLKGGSFEFTKDKPAVLNYDTNQKMEGNFVFYGPNSLAMANGPALATNLDGYPQVEIDANIPKGSSFKVFFDEAGVADTSNKTFDTSGGDDGESYYVELTSEKSGRELYKFALSDLKRRTSYGNQSGNSSLDMQAMKSITLNFTGLQGAGALTIHSVKLRKSESFFVHYFWYFMTASIVFFLAYTIFATPFVALGYEMTPDYHERTRLQASAQWLGQIAWLIVPWFYAIMYSKTLFDGPVHGARVLAIVVGVFIAVFGVIPAIFSKEHFGSLPKNKSRVGLWNNTKEFFKGFAITFKCKPFVKLCAVTFLVFNGFQLGISFSIYVMVFYLFAGDNTAAGTLQGWFGTVSVLGTMILVIPLLTWISTKLGKKRTLLITLSVSLVGYVLKWFGYNPDYPYLLLVSAPFIAFGIGSLFTLMGSMVADVCDYDELQTHQRREGMFGAIYWWMVKIGMSVAALLTGLLLNASGFDVALGSGQSPKTLFYLRIFDISIPIITFAIALLVISTYGITEEKAHEIRLELEKRRGK